jgi:hypothetical protein
LREEYRLRVFEDRVLRLFGLKREEDGLWRKLHNDDLHSLYSLLNIVRVIKSSRMRWAGHVMHMGDGRGIYGVLVGPKVRDYWEDLGIGGRITLRWTSGRLMGVNWIQLDQDRVQWWAFVSMVTNLWVL